MQEIAIGGPPFTKVIYIVTANTSFNRFRFIIESRETQLGCGLADTLNIGEEIFVPFNTVKGNLKPGIEDITFDLLNLRQFSFRHLLKIFIY